MIKKSEFISLLASAQTSSKQMIELKAVLELPSVIAISEDSELPLDAQDTVRTIIQNAQKAKDVDENTTAILKTLSSQVRPPYTAEDIAAIAAGQQAYRAYRSYVQYENLLDIHPAKVSQKNWNRLDNLLREGSAGIAKLRTSGNRAVETIKLEEDQAYSAEEKIICDLLQETLTTKHVTPGFFSSERLLSSKQLQRSHKAHSRHTGTQSGDDDNVFLTCGVGSEHRSHYDDIMLDFQGKSTVITIPLNKLQKSHRHLWVGPHLTDFIKATTNVTTLGSTKYSILHDPETKTKIYRYENAEGGTSELKVHFKDEIYRGKHVLPALIAQFILHLRLIGGEFRSQILKEALLYKKDGNKIKLTSSLQALMEVLMPSWISNEIKIPVAVLLQAPGNDTKMVRTQSIHPRSLAKAIYEYYNVQKAKGDAREPLSLEKFDDLNQVVEINGSIQHSPLTAAICYGPISFLEQLLKQTRKDRRNPNISVGVHINETRAMEVAIENKNLAAIKLLVRAGAEINTRLTSFLNQAADCNNYEIFNFFIDHYRNLQGKNAAPIVKPPFGVLILIMLARQGNCQGIEDVIKLGIAKVNDKLPGGHAYRPNADPDAGPDRITFPENYTALHAAGFSAQPKAFELLVKLGADVNLVDGFGNKPRDYYNKSASLMEVLEDDSALYRPLNGRYPVGRLITRAAQHFADHAQIKSQLFFSGAKSRSSTTKNTNENFEYNAITVITGRNAAKQNVVILGKRLPDSNEQTKDDNKWWLPGGEKMPTDNTLLEAAVREAQEETGLQLIRLVESGTITPKLICDYTTPANGSDVIYTTKVYHLDLGDELATKKLYANDDLKDLTKVPITQIIISHDQAGRQQGRFNNAIIPPSNMAMILQAVGKTPELSIASHLSDEREGFYRMRVAAKQGDLSEVKRLLLIGAPLFCEKDTEDFKSIFAAACAHGQLAIIQHLVEVHYGWLRLPVAQRYDAQCFLMGTNNPISLAIKGGHKLVLNYLLKNQLVGDWFVLSEAFEKCNNEEISKQIILFLANELSPEFKANSHTSKAQFKLLLNAITYVIKNKLDSELIPRFYQQMKCEGVEGVSTQDLFNVFDLLKKQGHNLLIGHLLHEKLISDIMPWFPSWDSSPDPNQEKTKLELSTLNAKELVAKVLKRFWNNPEYKKNIARFQDCLEMYISNQAVKTTGSVPNDVIRDDYEPKM